MPLNERLWAGGILAILRGYGLEDAKAVAKALLDAGVNTFEVTADSPDAWKMIHTLKTLNDRFVVGAGTVLDTEAAREAIQAGADFLFSPIVRPEMIQIAHRYGRMAIPGAMTPTEVVVAMEAGADIVKLFPAGSLGVAYLKEMRGPLPYVPFIPTGGITAENAAQFIKAGAVAVGMGSSLIIKEAVKQREFERITVLAKTIKQQIAEAC